MSSKVAEAPLRLHVGRGLRGACDHVMEALLWRLHLDSRAKVAAA